jgi:hypothetical protein
MLLQTVQAQALLLLLLLLPLGCHPALAAVCLALRGHCC